MTLCARFTSLRVFCRLAAIALLFLFASGGLVGQAVSSEDQLKAAFVFHFAQLVEWPQDALGADGKPLIICTAEDNSHSAALDSVVSGKQIGTHPVQTRRLHPKDDIHGCHLVVILGKDKQSATELLDHLKDAPVLTVGDSEDFAPSGGIIGLSLLNNKICFDINLNAAQRANLKISSRLLLLARTVIGGKQGG
jgi:hypothetical protein